MVFVTFYASWIVVSVISYFLFPVFNAYISSDSRIAYSLAVAWIIAFVVTLLFATLKGYGFGNSNSVGSDLNGRTFPANRFVNGISNGGKLTFNNDYMEFVPHNLNANTDIVKFYFKDINKATDVPIINNLKLIFKDGHDELLVMSRKKEKIDYINKRVNQKSS